MRKAILMCAAAASLGGTALAQTVYRPAPVMRAAPMFVTPPPLNRIALDREARLRARMQPSALAWIDAEGRRQARVGPSETRVREAVTTRWAVLGSMNNADIEALCFLVLMQAAKSAREDLKAIMAEVKAINQAKAEQRKSLAQAQAAQADAKRQMADEYGRRRDCEAHPADCLNDRRDSLSEQSEEQQLKMQMVMDRMAKADSAASNAMRKFSETSSQIIGNLK
ncbi:MAG: hypothetical protein ACXWVH_00140 [Caulobacteraceae bacterium]